MKKISLLFSAVAASLLLFTACEEAGITLAADYTIDIPEVVIAQEANPTTATFDETVGGINLDSVLSANGIDKSQIQSVKIQNVRCTVLNTNEINFDPLESLSLDLSIPGVSNPGPVQIVNVPSVETGKTELNLGQGNVTTQDLLPYFDYSDFNILGTITTDEGMPSDLRMQMSIKLEVQAKP
jgi:hypothetical protein